MCIKLVRIICLNELIMMKMNISMVRYHTPFAHFTTCGSIGTLYNKNFIRLILHLRLLILGDSSPC